MKKIRLEMDALRVSSFTTAAASDARGTVRGRQEDPQIDPLAEAAVYSSCIPPECPCALQMEAFVSAGC
jgi:hypothetical protein